MKKSIPKSGFNTGRKSETMKHLSIMLLCFLLASCAVTTQYQQYPALDPSNTPTAVIHVVRANSPIGLVITAPVYVDRYLIGRVGPGGHITTRVPVGRVFITSTTADIVLNTERDKSYFFEVTTPVQLWIVTPDFNVTAITRDRAREILGYDLDRKKGE